MAWFNFPDVGRRWWVRRPPRSPLGHPIGILSLPLPVSFSLSLCIAAKHDWLARESRPTEKEGRGRPGLSEGKRGERKDGYVETRGEERVARYQGFPHLHRQCLTSVAVARPPRDESITLNNVNVSPSQHKTNNHCSLPRPMGMAPARGSPVPHSPLASLVSTPPASSNTGPRLLCFSFRFSASRLRPRLYVASLKTRRSSSRTYALSREGR